MDDRDPIERAVATLREPVTLGSGVDRRIMTAVERGAWTTRLLHWLTRGRMVTVTPLRGLGVATAIVALLLFQWWWLTPTDAAREPMAAAGAELVQFVLVAPGASDVVLVGDFNDWSAAATPMRTVSGDGLWATTVPLTPGRYRYAFVVDGTTWVRDPAAPPTVEDDFGRPNSVLMVRGS